MKRARKKKVWQSSFHEGAQKHRVTVPRKFSHTGKRYDKYFDSQKAADKFIADILKERTEHGKSAVTAQQRHWINLAQTELGDLAILPKVIAHWKKTGDEAITPTLVKDAVVEFKKTQVNRVSETTF